MSEFLNDMSSKINTSASRVDAIMRTVTDFFAGTEPSTLKARFEAELGSITAGEFAYAEQLMDKYGFTDDQLHSNIEDLINIFRSGLEAGGSTGLSAGHPIDNYIAENLEIIKLAKNLLGPRENLEETYEKLLQVDLHYTRKENQLFPVFEKYGFDKPSKLMWTIHDDIRKAIKMCHQLFNADNMDKLAELEPKMLQGLQGMVFKEEKILFPTALEMFSESDWVKMSAGDAEIGFCFIGTPEPWTPSIEVVAEPEPVVIEPDGDAIRLDEGALSPEQINMMLKVIPFDVTYVDENDEVLFYNRGDNRVFPRSPEIIGRKVQNCHPPKSFHVVEAILNAFKSGEKSEASFWINMGKIFVLIKYFAVRDNNGKYRGTLEVSQEISEIRALEGERRILDWEQ